MWSIGKVIYHTAFKFFLLDIALRICVLEFNKFYWQRDYLVRTLFSNYCLAVSLQTLRQYQEDSLTHKMLIIAFLLIITWKSLGASKQGWIPKLSQAPNGFKLRTFQFIHNALTHWATVPNSKHCVFERINVIYKYIG